jgi:hypothetical protein
MEFFQCEDPISDDEPEDLIAFDDLISGLDDLISGLENQDQNFNITYQLRFLLKIFRTKTTDNSLRRARLLTKNVISHFTLLQIINQALKPPAIEGTLNPFVLLLKLVAQFRQFSTYLFCSKYFWKSLEIRLQQIAPLTQIDDVYCETRMCLFQILQAIIEYINEEDVDFLLENPVLKILIDSCHENYPASRKYLVEYRICLGKIILKLATFVDQLSPDCESTQNLKSRLFALGIQAETHLLDYEMLSMFTEQYIFLNHARGFLQGKIGCGSFGKSELLVKECANCDKRAKTKLQVCNQCYSIFYFGKKCQRKDWKRHKRVCRKNPFKF